jgi:universal stress protein A
MNAYQHILLAVDLSLASEQIALKAQQIAIHNQAKLSIIHVVEIMPLLDVNCDPMWPFDVDLNELSKKHAEKNLETFVEQLKLDAAHYLEQGSPKDEIIRVAKEQHVDLIVLGSHGRHGLALLLGSTANAVLHYAQCDVLAVRLADD